MASEDSQGNEFGIQMTERNCLFPALRCRMGSSIYYATFMSFEDIEAWIKPTLEIHANEELSRWIQRQLIKLHSSRIADYLVNQKERFFNAIVVGIYGGEPTWAPLDVTTPADGNLVDINDDRRERFQASIGILTLSGEEKLFAIDGQHRVAGIKEALQRSRTTLKDDEVIALFVGHETTKAGEKRTRRLFVTLNTTAKRVSDADRVALDEDDGFAVVTRRLVDEFDLFSRKKIIAFSPTASLPTNNSESISTILSIYSQLKDMYSTNMSRSNVRKSEFSSTRPSEEELGVIYEAACSFWRVLKRTVPEVNDVLTGKVLAGEYRQQRSNHLLMRPVGQRGFAGAVGVLISRGDTMAGAVKRLARLDLWIHKKSWNAILWDGVQNVMLKTPVLAETFLLRQVGEKGRSPSRDLKLTETLKKRDAN